MSGGSSHPTRPAGDDMNEIANTFANFFISKTATFAMIWTMRRRQIYLLIYLIRVIVPSLCLLPLLRMKYARS